MLSNFTKSSSLMHAALAVATLYSIELFSSLFVPSDTLRTTAFPSWRYVY